MRISIKNLFLNDKYTIFFLVFFIFGISLFPTLAFSSRPTFVSGTIATDTVWSAKDSPYVIHGSVSIYPEATLTIEPGVIVKFDYSSYLYVVGSLQADGTSDGKIYFTSIKDDSVGGDTNEDGNSSSPEPGDWLYIRFEPESNANINNTVIRYGGHYVPYYFSSPKAGIYNNGGTINISNSEIAYHGDIYLVYISIGYGIRQESGNLFITQSSIHDNVSSGIANYSSNVIEAASNWWGDVSGSHHSVLNVFGIGDSVSNNVNFIPWLDYDPMAEDTNQPPTISSVTQYKFDSQTPLDEGAITTHDSIVFKAVLSDADGDDVKLRVELKESGQSFNGQDLLESDFVSSDNEVEITRYGLINGEYHWRARAVDSQNNFSDWQEFGEEGNVDFEVKIVPLYTQVESEYPSIEETRRWFAEFYADADLNTGDGYDGCGFFIRNCGCAITSEVMLMRYYGITTTTDNSDVNPLTFNAWLTENNGYWSGGGVKWEKVADYSKNEFGVPRLTYHGPVDFQDINTLDTYLNNAKPVILHTKALNSQEILIDHFIVADDILSSTYAIKDPAWYNTNNLNQQRGSYAQDYNNSFQGLRLFGPLTTLPDSISVSLASPAELIITDPEGKKLGKNPITNTKYNEISEGVYYREGVGNPFPTIPTEQKQAKRAWIPTPTDGQYNIQVIGTGEGPYTLDMLAYDNEGDSQDILQEGSIQAGIIQEYELNYSQESADDAQLKRMVGIDIKPESDSNSINCQNKKGVIPVAILTTDIFDASTVNPDTIGFGPNKAREVHKDKGGKVRQHLEDIDNDGDLDLILHFRFEDMGIKCGETEATIIGQTQEGFDFIGSDSIRTIQNENKRKSTFVGKLLTLLVGVSDTLGELLD